MEGGSAFLNGAEITPEEMGKFWSRTEPRGECLYWTMAKTNGYGVWYSKGRRLIAHRVALASRTPEPEDGAWALHDCDNRWCVNPEHLHWGDHKMNMREAAERDRMRPGRTIGTHCPKGHEYTHENTRTAQREGTHGKVYIVHICRTCEREASRKYKANNAERIAAYQRDYKRRNRARLTAAELERRRRIKRKDTE